MNAGDPAGDYSGQKDIDGEPRVMLGRIDIGVDESDGMSQLIILTPTRDEILLSGQTYIITWQIPDNTNEILIEYSVDNGRNWNAVDPPNVGNYGSYNWLVPIARSNQCLVRLSDLNNPNVSDVSYDTFTIMSTEGIELKVPTQYATIQTAIDNCYDGDIVVILPGTYTAFGNRDLDFFGKAITVRSIDPNDPNIIALTIIDCNGTEQEPHRGFYFHSGETASSVVEGLTIINGCIRKNERLQGDGGGILCEVSSPTIRNCIITHNVAYGVGGGIACLNSSSPEISNSTISSNIGHNSHGGGIYCFYGSSPKIINCKIINNKASHRGGGVSCRINSSPMISNCFLSANFAGMEGSGLFCYDSEPRLLNCIISDNTVHEQEDAMRFWDSPGSLVSGCIISGRIKITGGTVPITYSNVQGGWSGEGNIGADPCFVSPGYRDANGVWIDGDYHLLQTSACINTADNNSLPADTQDLDGDGNTTEPIPFDIEGNPRIVYDVVDMGPYEFYNTAPIADAGSDQIVECACSTEEGTKVTLDGTNSSDPDRGVLTYTWTGPFDESPAHGVSPTVTLEDGCPGEYVITLVVNDGIDDSEPNDILITVVDTTPPVITCPADVTLQCPADTSVEANGSATAGDTCGTVTITHSNQWQPSCGNTGTLERTWTATDECGNSSNCVQTLTVVDSTPPEFTLSVTPTMLWPPNHKIELITPSWTVSDECDAAPDVSLVGIVANEGDNTIGDGHTSNDIQINEDGSIYLRSERSGRGSDRVYTITYQAMDDCGNITVRNATVSIPHNFKVLARIASRWLWAGQGRIPEDLNGDGFVNLKDIAIFANNWIR